jgi:hypothetical protein
MGRSANRFIYTLLIDRASIIYLSVKSKRISNLIRISFFHPIGPSESANLMPEIEAGNKLSTPVQKYANAVMNQST